MAEHATQAVIGWGTQIQYGLGTTPETYANFHEVETSDLPDEQADEVEASHFESPDKTKEYVLGMIDSGEFTFTVAWRPDVYADHQMLVTDKASGATKNYRAVLPGGMETISFPGRVKGLKRGLGISDLVTMDVTIRCGALTSVMPIIT